MAITNGANPEIEKLEQLIQKNQETLNQLRIFLAKLPVPAEPDAPAQTNALPTPPAEGITGQ